MKCKFNIGDKVKAAGKFRDKAEGIMIKLDGSPEVSIKIREVKDKPGKEIILVFDKYEILLDNRCLGKDTKACDKCKLKFRCYSSDALRINFEKDLVNMSLPSERPTLGEVIQWYLQGNGVEPKLTGIVAYNEDGEASSNDFGKMIEDEAKRKGIDPKEIDVLKKMMAGGLRNQLKCPHCGEIFDFDYIKDIGKYECPKCGHKWKK